MNIYLENLKTGNMDLSPHKDAKGQRLTFTSKGSPGAVRECAAEIGDAADVLAFVKQGWLQIRPVTAMVAAPAAAPVTPAVTPAVTPPTTETATTNESGESTTAAFGTSAATPDEEPKAEEKAEEPSSGSKSSRRRQ